MYDLENLDLNRINVVDLENAGNRDGIHSLTVVETASGFYVVAYLKIAPEQQRIMVSARRTDTPYYFKTLNRLHVRLRSFYSGKIVHVVHEYFAMKLQSNWQKVAEKPAAKKKSRAKKKAKPKETRANK